MNEIATVFVKVRGVRQFAQPSRVKEWRARGLVFEVIAEADMRAVGVRAIRPDHAETERGPRHADAETS